LRWDLEWELQQQGFDFCYDKKLYDRLEHGNAESVRLHLCADLVYQNKLLRFVENHDEPRAAVTFLSAKGRAAAITMATLPGMKLFHEGQFEGRRVRSPVFLGRRPVEDADADLSSFYTKLLEAINRPVFREGEWKLCDGAGWPDNESFRNLVSWCWLNGEERYLIVVNLSDSRSQSMIHISWGDLGGRTWKLLDAISGTTYERDGNDLSSSGLYVDLEPWGYHLFCASG
jgi:hypothetical protein